MSAIRGTGTKPELLLRKGLHARGFRFRLHEKKLPGRPDLVLSKYRAVIFANGCFWHGHDCALFRWPATREVFWREKITGNMARDAANIAVLKASGWRIAIVWECALKGRSRRTPDEVIDCLSNWLFSEDKILELRARELLEGKGRG